MDNPFHNPYQSPGDQPRARRRGLTRAILLLVALPLVALLLLGAYRLWDGIRYGSDETIWRGWILCGVLTFALVGGFTMTRDVWRDR